MSSGADVSVAKPGNDFGELSIAIACGLILAFTAMFLCVAPISGNMAGSRDFVVFWAAGQQAIHHANAYDPAVMDRIEHSAGLYGGYPVILFRYPPWALPMVLPLGLVGLRVGAVLWSLATLACLFASVGLLWRMHGRPKNHLHWIVLSFGPAMFCAMMGQSSLFALLGYVLFLRLHLTRPFAAGLTLWLCILKPHLFLPFGTVLLAWVIVSRSYKILAGAAVAMAASCAAAWLVDPAAWGEYSRIMQAPGFEKAFVPSLSAAMRIWLSPDSVWLQYLPATLTCAWSLTYFWPRRHAWEWSRQGGRLVLISLVVAPYSYVYDGGLAIPALLEGIYLTRSRYLQVVLAFASLSVLVELVWGASVMSGLYLWTVPVWFLWYMLARASANDLRLTRPQTQWSSGA